MSDLTRLDIETKVALMAALVYDGGGTGAEPDAVEFAVDLAMRIEKESHRRVTEQISEKRKCGGG